MIESLTDNLVELIIIYFSFINILGFIFMGADKYKAKNNRYRIPERTLFTIAWVGGSLGVYLGCLNFRHKTLHRSFKYGVPFIFIFTYSIAGYLLFFTNVI